MDGIKAAIASEHYFTAADGVSGEAQERAKQENSRTYGFQSPPALELLTFCVLVMHSGFAVTGESVCASPEKFDEEIERKVARQNAEQKIVQVWAREGIVLKQTLHEQAQFEAEPKTGFGFTLEIPAHQLRVMNEHAELVGRTEKLAEFFGTPIFQGIDQAEKSRLSAQMDVMVAYGDILSQRIAAF